MRIHSPANLTGRTMAESLGDEPESVTANETAVPQATSTQVLSARAGTGAGTLASPVPGPGPVVRTQTCTQPKRED